MFFWKRDSTEEENLRKRIFGLDVFIVTLRRLTALLLWFAKTVISYNQEFWRHVL